ncbi:hypothetical protein H9P43_008895 [Blastocladiella emersonii ATCC 22665]|nr:hypothetical protein H9P43_008895 [Blastocladiella emersonii ATCC 22665]
MEDDELDRRPSAGADSDSDSDSGDDAGASSSSAPLNQAIRIFARIRPRKVNTKIRSTSDGNAGSKVQVDGPLPGDDGAPQLHFHVPRDETLGSINNTKEHFGFRFDRVFDGSTTQEEVFDHVAKDIVLSVMDGFNATIFAYGQTGSGKTFTITGGAEKYADRGLIPRTVQFLFREMAQRPNRKYQVQVSYLEIYNEAGYDLLDDSRDAKRLEDLPKVTLRETGEEQIHLQNLHAHPVVSEEEALNWLFMGDTNKMIAETPSNPASSRSHCLFILTVTSREAGSEVVRKAKLHLVDLAGSERVAKTGIDGTLLKEAKSINLSLHFLEHVIVALHEKALGKRSHVPYRNSMMTSILRDSLGGNCKTCMIATLATEDHLIEESISTCRFAQRVALINNRVSVNEELDPYMVIARLKQQILQLKAELALARGESADGVDDALPEYEIDRCRQLVHAYLAGDDTAVMFTDYRKVLASFDVMRKMVRERGGAAAARGGGELPPPAALPPPVPQPSGGGGGGADPAEVAQLKRLLAQRDTEISVLIPMVNQYKARLRALEKGGSTGSVQSTEPPPPPLRNGNSSSSSSSSSTFVTQSTSSSLASLPQGTDSVYSSSASLVGPDSAHVAAAAPPAVAALQPADKQVLLEAFKATYAPMASIEAQKAELKECYARAKALGQTAHRLREEIKHAKDKLSCLRNNLDPSSDSAAAVSCRDLIEAEEAKLRGAIADRTAQYKAQFGELKQLKLEIEHMQHLLDKAKLQLNRDFAAWLKEQEAQRMAVGSQQPSAVRREESRVAAATPPPGGPRGAWQTPSPRSNGSGGSATAPLPGIPPHHHSSAGAGAPLPPRPVSRAASTAYDSAYSVSSRAHTPTSSRGDLTAARPGSSVMYSRSVSGSTSSLGRPSGSGSLSSQVAREVSAFYSAAAAATQGGSATARARTPYGS